MAVNIILYVTQAQLSHVRVLMAHRFPPSAKVWFPHYSCIITKREAVHHALNKVNRWPHDLIA